jgi:phosphoribosylformylglycinamidine (FGAM) synthase-like amidotransferase family enzyme
MTNIELDTMRAVKSAAIHSTRICWDDVRNNAAIAVLPQCVAIINNMLVPGGYLTEDTMAKQAAKIAVNYADELVNELKNKNNEKK